MTKIPHDHRPHGDERLTEGDEALTSHQCPACERAISLLQLYCVPPERARTVVNGIEVLMTRSRKEAVAVNATIERLRAALEKAYALLAYAAPDSELVEDEPAWMEECDEWLDEYAPSKLAQLSGDSAAPETRYNDRLRAAISAALIQMTRGLPNAARNTLYAALSGDSSVPETHKPQEIKRRPYRATDCICEHPDDLTVPGNHHHRSCPLRDPKWKKP